MTLVDTNEAFYHQDFDLDGKPYRIFNYRLSSYSDFLLPSAMECRGIMFEIHYSLLAAHVTGDGARPVRLASLPMEKFFNLNENPMTMELDLTTVVSAEPKADGSLMSTYLHNGELRLKSKGSLFSDQAVASMKYLAHEDRVPLCTGLTALANMGYTVNLEWCAPDNRIVLGYTKPALIVLNVRNMLNGEYVDLFMLSALGNWKLDAVRDAIADPVDLIPSHTWTQFVEAIPLMTGIEGFVLMLESGQRVKVKTEWYLSLHHAKDSVNNPRRLFECILSEGIDDVRSMFFDDPMAIELIDEMQLKVDHLYNHMVKTTEAFYAANKHLSKKEYVLLAKDQLEQLHFNLVLGKYDRPDDPTPFKTGGCRSDYKGYLKSKWKVLGLKDESLTSD